MENDKNIIEITDEDGIAWSFELLDTIKYENNDYIVVIDDNEDADEVIIFKLDEDNDKQKLCSEIEDEDVLNAVFDIFKERNADEFDFED